MPGIKLPPDFVWRQESDYHTLYLGDTPLIRISPLGGGWIARTMLQAPGIAPQQLSVRSVDHGKGWGMRWVEQRQRLVARLCSRPDLAPPPPLPKVRHTYGWPHAGVG